MHRNRMEIARISHGARAASVEGMVGIVRWLCDPHVFLGIPVPNVYNYSFLIGTSNM